MIEHEAVDRRGESIHVWRIMIGMMVLSVGVGIVMLAYIAVDSLGIYSLMLPLGVILSYVVGWLIDKRYWQG